MEEKELLDIKLTEEDLEGNHLLITTLFTSHKEEDQPDEDDQNTKEEEEESILLSSSPPSDNVPTRFRTTAVSMLETSTYCPRYYPLWRSTTHKVITQKMMNLLPQERDRLPVALVSIIYGPADHSLAVLVPIRHHGYTTTNGHHSILPAMY